MHPSWAGTSHNKQFLGLGAFTATNPPKSSTQKSYAEAAGPKAKHPQEARQAPPQHAKQPPPPSRKRADPQSEPTQPQTNTTQFASPPHDDEEEPDDTPFFIQLAQLAEDKKDIKSKDVATYTKYLLSKLEGLDATPDGMDKGR